MTEKIEMTPEEYKRLKKLEREISDYYQTLYQQVLHMQLLVSAYFDNDANHHLYNSDDIFDLIFNVSEELYSSALNMHKIVYCKNCIDKETGG